MSLDLGSISWISAIFLTSNAVDLMRIVPVPCLSLLNWLFLIATTMVFAVTTAVKAERQENQL